MDQTFIPELRQAARTLSKDRAFTSVAVGTLGVGLALCVTVAVLLQGYLLRGLPYPESDRLYDVRFGTPGTPGPRGLEKLDWTSLDDVIELPIAWDLDLFNVRGGPYPEALQGSWVTPGYVAGFGVHPAVGRGFLPSDFQAGRPTVALISHRLWRTRFSGDPQIVGHTFEAYVNDRPNEVETFTIVGVMDERHWHLNAFTEVLAPLRAPTYPYMVRVSDGSEPSTVADRITALVRAANPELPANWRAELVSTHATYVREIRPLLLAVAIATGLVTLIACANVAVLLTVRATRRRHELALRQALGATGGQLLRALVAEPLLLGVAATSLAVALAWMAINALAPVLGHYLGRPVPGGATTLTMDGPTTIATIAAGFMAIALCSIVPLWISRRTPVSIALTGGQKGATEGPAQRRARSVLIAVEVAACLTLLVGAGLTIQSAVHMLRVDMGLATSDVLVGRFSLRQRSYPDAGARANFYERVLSRRAELTGVQAIAFASGWPLQQTPPRDVGRLGADPSGSSGLVGVSADYFSALDIQLREGRTFTSADRVGTEPVVVISQTLATRVWPNERAVGQQLRIAPQANSGPDARPLVATVVGVVGDVRHTHTDQDLADAYVPILQFPSPSPFVYLRGSADIAAVERGFRGLLASIDGEVALAMPRALAEILDLQRAGARLLAWVLVVFAAFAAALALVGIYGVIAYAVRQREREIAVRLAIGADRGTITRMFVRQGAVVLAAGLAVGVAGAVALGRVLRTQLFEVRPEDPAIIAVTTVAFAVCGLAAVAWPARAAAATDPAAALKD
jgi:putative ABC transport system permease protein